MEYNYRGGRVTVDKFYLDSHGSRAIGFIYTDGQIYECLLKAEEQNAYKKPVITLIYKHKALFFLH